MYYTWTIQRKTYGPFCWKHIQRRDKIKVSYNPDKNEKVYVKKVIFEDIRFTVLLIGFTVLQIVIGGKFKNSKELEKENI